VILISTGWSSNQTSWAIMCPSIWMRKLPG
jgi:hypothetical protein